jgi:hypothetical protein
MERVNTGVALSAELVGRIVNEPSVAGLQFNEAVEKLLTQQLQYLEDHCSDEAWVKRCMAKIERMPVGQTFGITTLLAGQGPYNGKMLRLLHQALRGCETIRLFDTAPNDSQGERVPARFERIAKPENTDQQQEA